MDERPSREGGREGGLGLLARISWMRDVVEREGERERLGLLARISWMRDLGDREGGRERERKKEGEREISSLPKLH